ncbi:MAG: hypothetical protein KAT16_08885 [Candidatus Heimdallarchaeota archaeon]|nr:hypothetical protein [Candidatus Heimdallarchaeota archaeon]
MAVKNLIKEGISGEKTGFHRWAWLMIFLLGGVLMIFGGLQDIMLFFSSDVVPIPSWHPAPPEVGLICGFLVLISAGLSIILSLQLRKATGLLEKTLAQKIALISLFAMVCDWISGYYGFGSFIALIITIWLIRR